MLLEWLPILVALLATGALAGLLAGLLGVGGGIVIVPVLYWVFQLLGVSAASSMVVATGTSLLTIIPTSISSIRSHHARGNVDWAVVRLWAGFIAVGVAIGVMFTARAGGEAASLVFGVVSILIALQMLLRTHSTGILDGLPAWPWQGLVALGIGAISAIMGIGGGTLGVLALTACGVGVHRAVATSSAFGFVIAVPGAMLMLVVPTTPADAPPATFGLVNLLAFIAIAPLTVLMAPFGVRLGGRLPAAGLKRVFAVFLIISGARMIYQTMN